MYKVIIAGSRDFRDYETLKNKMDYLLANRVKEGITVLCGLARGADKLGQKYAKEKGYNVEYYPADWNRFGRAAGYIRNEEMAQNADALIAFWDGKSKGTHHMINLAEKYKLKIRIIKF